MGTKTNNQKVKLKRNVFCTNKIKVFDNSFLGVIFALTVGIHALLGIPLYYKKKKLKLAARSGSEPEVQRYNNIKSNGDLAKGLVNVTIIGSFVASIYVVFNDWKEEIVVPTLLGFLIPVFVISVAVPLRIVIAKPAIRNHVKAHFSLLY